MVVFFFLYIFISNIKNMLAIVILIILGVVIGLWIINKQNSSAVSNNETKEAEDSLGYETNSLASVSESILSSTSNKVEEVVSEVPKTKKKNTTKASKMNTKPQTKKKNG